MRNIEEREAWDVAGPHDAHTIVCVHASSWSRKMWLPQIEALADTYHIVAPDLPEHGQRAATRFRLATAVQAVADAIDAEADGPVLLVGLSLGGYVAMAYADQHPERVAGLVLAGCSVGFDGFLGLLTRLSALVFGVLIRCFSRRYLNCLARRQAAWVRQLLPERLAEPVIAGGFSMGAWGHALLELVSKDFHKMLAAYPGPVLIINGEYDKYNREAQRGHARAAQNARLEIIPGAGHMSNLERPQAFARLVRRFAERLDWPPSCQDTAVCLSALLTAPVPCRGLLPL